mgnify:CR=1 FL=1
MRLKASDPAAAAVEEARAEAGRRERALELLVEAGFSPLEAIRIGTLNGATYLGRGALTGSIAAGKLADLVIIDGNPATSIGDIRKVQLVFRQGVGYDPAALIESVKGKVGLW